MIGMLQVERNPMILCYKVDRKDRIDDDIYDLSNLMVFIEKARHLSEASLFSTDTLS